MKLPGWGDSMALQTYTALPPLVYDDSEYLFLVTMPSYDSEMCGEYFGDPSNHFWKVLSAIYSMPIENYAQKKQICQEHKIAIWSVCKSCKRHLSMQDTMTDIVFNDINGFLQQHPSIQTLICVSHDAEKLLKESDWNLTQNVVYVPSPSGADFYYEHVDELVPRYAAALNVPME